MTIAKRLFTAFSAFALCAVMSLGSLSFMPKSFSLSPSDHFDIVGERPSGSFAFEFHFLCCDSGNSSSSNYFIRSYYLNYTGGSPTDIRINGWNRSHFIYGSLYPLDGVTSVTGFYGDSTLDGSSVTWHSFSSNSPSYNLINGYFIPSNFYYSTPNNFSFGRNASDLTYHTFSIDFIKPPLTSIPSFGLYTPFYFPQLPHGEFDGNINVVDGSYNIDFPSNASISGAINQTGNDHYTWTWNHGTLYWNGETVQGEHEGWISPDYQNQVYPNGDITQTSYANRLINLSLSDLDSVVNYTPAYNENSRFRCWSCVMDSSYVWFVSDTRNKISGSIVSVTSDEVTWKYEFSDPQGGNTIYPTWAIVFSPMGEVIQVLSPTSVSNKNTYSLSCSIGTLEQDQDTGIWSCDPLYHGFWFSDDSPPVANITHLNVAENKKYLANPVFGESAFQLQFLDSINRGISDINTNILSLQSAMQSSISGQTSDFQNMDAPSAPQPSTSQMMDYFSKESAFSAPNTDEVFSGDIKSGHYWDGVTWWSSKFNDIIVSNQVIVAFTTAMLTLGLAVLIIGRRFSMR